VEGGVEAHRLGEAREARGHCLDRVNLGREMERRQGDESPQRGHEARIDALGRRADRADRDVRHEVPIHDVDVDPVRTRHLRLSDFLAEAREVGREDGRGEGDPIRQR
jgi:hypothetical protein